MGGEKNPRKKGPGGDPHKESLSEYRKKRQRKGRSYREGGGKEFFISLRRGSFSVEGGGESRKGGGGPGEKREGRGKKRSSFFTRMKGKGGGLSAEKKKDVFDAGPRGGETARG